jgi:hypothetical protein
MPIVQKSIDSLGYQPVDERLIAEDIQALIEEVNILSEGGGGSDYTETIVNISSAQILAMGTTPIELLPPLPIGKIYDIHQCEIYFTKGSVNYTISSGDMIYIWSDQRDILPLIDGNLINGNDKVILTGPIGGTYFDNVKGYTFMTASNPFNSESIVLTMYSGVNPTLGNGTLRVKIYHKTITFGA